MKSYFVTVTFFIIIFLAGQTDRITATPLDYNYLPGRLIVKLERDVSESNFLKFDDNQAVRPETLLQLQSILKSYDVHEITPVFSPAAMSNVQELKRSRSKITSKATELAGSLQRTFEITYGSGDDPIDVAAEIENSAGVEYAEPHYIYRTAGVADLDNPAAYQSLSNSMNSTENEYIPNDPLTGPLNNNLFDYLNIFKAWGINRGSPDVVIAIIDTGVYYDHPDLKDNLWHNTNIGDANRFFDDFEIQNDSIGWNFWESGNIFKGEDPEQNANPIGNYNRHGTLVAGVAAAVTDNSRGIAGVGFQTKFMPVKTGGTKDFPEVLAYAIHGIIYAAIYEADIINCSFVGLGNSRFAAEAIDFALEMGSVVVAAIGNSGISTSGTYPALFDDVLSVGALKDSFDDRVSGFSNFGYKLDVFAVGENVMSTTFGYDEATNTWEPGYDSSTGTSLATPIVSGLAGLLKAENPDWPAQRILSQIRNTSRSISLANPEPKYEDKLGYGVIDGYAALTEDIPVISILDFTFTNDENMKLNAGEAGTLTVEGIHFGGNSPEFVFELESLQPGVTLHTSNRAISNLSPGEIFNIDFSVSIDSDLSLVSVPVFRLTWAVGDSEDPSYKGLYIIQYDELLFGNMQNNRLSMSIPSDGTLGFMQPADKSVGIGFVPSGYDNILSEAGFMITGYRNDEPVIINQVRVKDSSDIARHFLPVKNFRFQNHPSIRNILIGLTGFNSMNHPFAKDLEIELEAVTLIGRLESRPVLFLNYHITNNSGNTYSDLHFGIFNYWKFREKGLHQLNFSETEKLMYVSHESDPFVAGIAMKGEISGALGIDNASSMTLDRSGTRSDSLSFGITYTEENELHDGFTDEEKRLALTSGKSNTSITAEDASMVLSTGPYTLYPDASVSVGFAYAWGYDLQQLKNQLASAFDLDYLTHSEAGGYSKTGKVADVLTLHANYPNPFNNQTNIRFDLMEPAHVELAVYDLLGRRVAILVNEVRELGPHFVNFNGAGLASGTYLAILKVEGKIRSDMLMLVK